MTTLRTRRPTRRHQLRARPTSLRPYLWMLCSGVAFVAMGALAHSLRSRCDWQIIALARSSIALLATGVLVLYSGKQFVFFRPPVLWLRSLAGSISLICTFYAFSRLPPADVFTLTNMVPLWVAVLSWPLLGKFPSVGVWVCAALGVVGVAFIQQANFENSDVATLLALISSFTSAIAMLGLNRLHYLDPRAIVFHFSAVGTIVCVVSLFVFERTHSVREMGNVPTLLGLLGTGAAAAVGQLFLTKAYAAGAPAKVAVVGLTQILFSLVLDVLVFHHGVTALTLMGIALIVGPTAWVVLQRGAPAETV